MRQGQTMTPEELAEWEEAARTGALALAMNPFGVMCYDLEYPDKLRAARVEAGYSGDELAARLGYASPNSIYQWENGSAPVPSWVIPELDRLLGRFWRTYDP